jgi:protein-S-isoprenylcysteine O-methyltransferase Ste14
MSAEHKPVISGVGFKRFIQEIQHSRHRFRQFLGIMLLILFTIVGKPIWSWFLPGLVVIALGIAVRLWASGHVKKDKELATTGPYAYVRHPLYVGNHLLTFGFCLASGLWWSYPLWIVFGFLFYPQTIRDEDRQLAQLFPQEWPAWRKGTRALIPRLTPYSSEKHGEWSFRQSLRRNGEPIIAALLLLCVYFLYVRLP